MSGAIYDYVDELQYMKYIKPYLESVAMGNSGGLQLRSNTDNNDVDLMTLLKERPEYADMADVDIAVDVLNSSPSFYVDNKGNMICNNATISGKLENSQVNNGAIRGGTLGIGSGGPYNGYNTFIESNGRLRCNNAIVSGTVNANSGTFNNVTIKGNCKIEGNISANQVTGVKKSLGKYTMTVPPRHWEKTFSDIDTGIVMTAWGKGAILVEIRTGGGVESPNPNATYWHAQELVAGYTRTRWSGNATYIIGSIKWRCVNGYSSTRGNPATVTVEVWQFF